jgi:hypothetical protein
MQEVEVRTKISNPFWDDLEQHLEHVLYWIAPGDSSLWRYRANFCRNYAWAIPDPETVAFVYQWLAPKTIEMGAGRGYWASVLASMGLDILAFDHSPPDLFPNAYFHPEGDENGLQDVFYPVQIGEAGVVQAFPDRALFLCWPPYDEPMAYDVLRTYTGQRVVFIGEDEGGCTGDSAFFSLLEEEWHLVAQHLPIQWHGIHDMVRVFERGAVEEDCAIPCSMSVRPERPKSNFDFSFDRQPLFSRSFDYGLVSGRFLSSLPYLFHTTISAPSKPTRTPEELRRWLKRVCPSLARKYYPEDYAPLRRFRRKRRRQKEPE